MKLNPGGCFLFSDTRRGNWNGTQSVGYILGMMIAYKLCIRRPLGALQAEMRKHSDSKRKQAHLQVRNKKILRALPENNELVLSVRVARMQKLPAWAANRTSKYCIDYVRLANVL